MKVWAKMLFNSYTFLFLFLPFFLLTYYAAPVKCKNTVLVIFSYLFYGWNEPLYMIILLFSTVVDFVVAIKMSSVKNRKLLLYVSVFLNLALLCFFKYYYFFVLNWNYLSFFTAPGLSIENIWAFTVPIGVSFYTFQSMSYSIDVYRREVEAEKNFIDFACYVSMFPQLIAGPILRFREVRLFLKERQVTKAAINLGAGYLCCGLFRKVVLGDSCGVIADAAFGTEGILPGYAWAGMLAFSFQIYFDFSGYSDIAIGLGYLLGFQFPENFDSPYKSSSLSEFWQRWHITFSSWLRDYLYIPLGGNKKGKARTLINLFLVMFLGGLWHGASWNFVLWGIAHGVILGIERTVGGTTKKSTFGIVRTFLLVSLLWVLFRTATFEEALLFYKGLLGIGVSEVSQIVTVDMLTPWNVLVLCFSAGVVFFSEKTSEFLSCFDGKKACYTLVLFVIAVLFVQAFDNRLFIYFRF